MTRPAEVFALLLAWGACASAQDAAHPSIFIEASSKPPSAPARAPAPPAVSTALSAQIAAALPTYADKSRTPPPVPPREVPRNRIIRLPAYIVRQVRITTGRSEPFVLSDFYTPAEAERQKMIHYLNFDSDRGNALFVKAWKFLFQGAADLQYEQDQVIARKQEMAGLEELEDLREEPSPSVSADERAAPSAVTPDLGGSK